MNKNIDQTENTHDEHDYDGIKEQNNPAPVWIMVLFLITIGFSGIYFVKYFGFPENGRDQTSEYKSIMQENGRVLTSSSGKSYNLSDPTMIESGNKLFHEKGCVACHGNWGEGNNVGPNLTDHYWIWGCKTDQVVFTITEGRADKGMAPFKSRLSELQIHQLTSYILKKLVDSSPQNAKAAQGEECK